MNRIEQRLLVLDLICTREQVGMHSLQDLAGVQLIDERGGLVLESLAVAVGHAQRVAPAPAVTARAGVEHFRLLEGGSCVDDGLTRECDGVIVEQDFARYDHHVQVAADRGRGGECIFRGGCSDVDHDDFAGGLLDRYDVEFLHCGAPWKERSSCPTGCEPLWVE